MRTAGIAMIALLALTATAEAKRYKKHGWKHADGYDRPYRKRRTYSQRDIDRLPLRETRPPGSGEYIYDQYPLWAAQAFQPKDWD